MAESSTIAADVMVWIGVIAIILFLFCVAVTLMIRYRGRKLTKATKDIPREGLDLSENELEKIHGLISQTWDRRFQHRPIPELNHLADGWMKEGEGEPFCIRDKISKSTTQIELCATEINSKYSRKPYQSFEEYLTQLRHSEGSNIKKSDCQKYLQYYHSARYGNTDLQYDSASYALFQQVFSTLLSQIRTLP